MNPIITVAANAISKAAKNVEVLRLPLHRGGIWERFDVPKRAFVSRLRRAPIRGEVQLGFAEDFEDRAAVGFGDFRELRVVVFAGEDGAEAGEDAVAHDGRERIEGGGVDEEAARVFEKAGAEIEVAEGAAEVVARAGGGEVADELGAALDGCGERGFLGEKEAAEEGVGLRLEVADVAVHGGHLLGLEVQPRDVIVHVRLMLEDHEGDDVAAGRERFRRIEKRAEVGEVAAPAGLGGVAREVGVADEIAPMRLRAVLSGDIPAGPAVGERRAVVDVADFARRLQLAARVRGHGAQDVAGHAERALAAVALQAVRGARELRLAHLFLLQRVENAAEFRIDGGDLHDRRARDVTDVDVVAEIKRARILRRDGAALERGFREDDGLRGARHMERVEEAGEVAEGVVPRELHLARLDAPGEPRHGIVRLARAVAHRRGVVFERVGGALEIFRAGMRGEAQRGEGGEELGHREIKNKNGRR